MKKILSLLMLVAVFISCEDDATFNNPSVQGKKDNVRWRASSSYATITGGVLTVYGNTPFETLTLTTASIAPGTYTLGVSSANKATYTYEADGVTSVYTTGTGVGDGQIKIEQSPEGTVTGTFYFNAPSTTADPIGAPVVNYQEGHFYRVPIQTAP
ncbi:DUF6252 family protein [uncultured Flavobacterium sp.]|uniref:DUF6252 family protein n=1 Tax=uncultured Flavobacterium sp. TaxID=165435 RepID=UPI00120D043C|nr:DUF6252 family protein [uncultured Flavobacterium sp.]THD33234.1 MAG: hypothetical protein DI588_04660 [Flavobacterium johnsoniae]